MPRHLVFILCALFLAACQPVSQTTATVDVPVTQTAVTETAKAVPTETAAPSVTPSPSETPSPSPTVDLAAGTPTASPIPPPTLVPMLEPSQVPGLLEYLLTVEADSFNGHAIRKVTRWAFGFKNFKWWGENHLQLNAIVGEVPIQEDGNDRIITYPAVINLNSGQAWALPSQDSESKWLRSALWLPQFQQTIVTQAESSEIFNPDGELIKTYPGRLLSVSPSGTKLLFYDGTVLDMISGKTVKFAWEEGFYGSFKPIWSSDESQVFVCCSVFGNVKTGESGYTETGQMFGYGRWILNDKYILTLIGEPGVYSSPGLFNVSTQEIQSVGELAGIPGQIEEYDNKCNEWDLSPDGGHIWITCFDGSHLVDLVSFKSWDYPEYTLSSEGGVYVNWSRDSKFLKINNLDKILSLETKKILRVRDDCYPVWPPAGNVLLCRSVAEPALLFLDARTMAIQKVLKMESPCNFKEDYTQLPLCISDDKQTLFFLDMDTMSVENRIDFPIGLLSTHKSPDENFLVLLAQDGSLWLADYPTLENLKQVTPAMPGQYLTRTRDLRGFSITSRVRQVTWSPDSRFLAFLGDTDIYIVDTIAAP